MKKASSVLLIVLLAVAMMFAMAACSNDQPTEGNDVVNENVDENNANNDAEVTAPSGKYVPGTIIDAEGTEMSYEDYVAAGLVAAGYEEGSSEYELGMQAADLYYTFNEDGSVVGTAMGQDITGTYTVDGTTVTATFDVEGAAPLSMEYDSAADTLTVVDAATGITSVLVADK